MPLFSNTSGKITEEDFFSDTFFHGLVCKVSKINTRCTLKAVKAWKGMVSSVDDLLTLSKLKNTDTSRSITTKVIYQELRQLATMAAMSNAKWVNWRQIVVN